MSLHVRRTVTAAAHAASKVRGGVGSKEEPRKLPD
jgi:hypothetical protein